MRLSDAVALGLPEIRFTNEAWLGQASDGSCFGCLVGAAMFAVGLRNIRFNQEVERKMAELWPWLAGFDWEPHPCPRCKMIFDVNNSVEEVFTHLAEHYRHKEMTMEQIVSYVRSVEPQEEPVKDREAEFYEQRAGLNEPPPEEPTPDACSWCGANAKEAADRHEGPHLTWCVHFRESQRGGPQSFIEAAKQRIERNSWRRANHGARLVIDALRKNGDAKL